MIKRNEKKNKGFTLIELLVVISIIGSLSSTVLASVSDTKAKADDTRQIQNIKQLQTALELYYNKYGYYPRDNQSVHNWHSESNLGPLGFSTILQPLVDEGFISQLPKNIFAPSPPSFYEFIYNPVHSDYCGSMSGDNSGSYIILFNTNKQSYNFKKYMYPMFPTGWYCVTGTL